MTTGIITQTARNQNARVNSYTTLFNTGGENISATPVSVLSVTATNKAASGVVYVQLFDSTAAPTGLTPGVIPPIAVPFGQTVSVSFNDVCGGQSTFGVATSSGLTWGASSTAATYTADATDISVQIRYTN